MSTHTNLVAALIVKDEEPVIRRLLDSLQPHVDRVIVSDTGSTDRTIQILYERNCSVIERPWVDFSTNRNQVLENASTAGCYVLCGIDADEELVVPEGFTWPEFTALGYALMCHNQTLQYRRTAIVAPNAGWEWRGVIHEALVHPTQAYIPLLEGPYIRVGTGGARSRDPQTLLKDLGVLQQAVADEPDNPRYQFYRAQTLRDLKMLDAARAAYIQRAAMPGWPPETAYAQYMIGKCSEWLGDLPLPAYSLAYAQDTSRAEPLYAMAQYYRNNYNDAMAAILARSASMLAPPAHGFMVDSEVYEWRALDLFVTTAYYVPHLRTEGAFAFEALMKRNIPDDQRERIIKNGSFY